MESRNEIRKLLGASNLALPAYQKLEWRVDAEVGAPAHQPRAVAFSVFCFTLLVSLLDLDAIHV